MKRNKPNITYQQRLQIYEYIKNGLNKKQIAQELHCCLATIYNEINRGSLYGQYNPDYSQNRYKNLKKHCGRQKQLYINTELSQSISDLINNDNLSVREIIRKYRATKTPCPSKTTIYKAIHQGLIPNVTMEVLHKKKTTMFSNGLVQIPIWIREKLNLKDGDTLKIQYTATAIVLEKNDKN